MMPKPTNAPKRKKKTRVIARLAAAMLTVMLLCQLFGYEDFAAILSGVLTSNDSAVAVITAAALVFAELLALPYLLGMYVSPLMRVASALLGGFVTSFWLLTSLTNAHASNSGLFSSTIELSGGILPVVWSFVLTIAIVHVFIADTKYKHDRVV